MNQNQPNANATLQPTDLPRPNFGKRQIRLGILISGRGSNMMAIHQALLTQPPVPAAIALVLANHTDAAGIAYAQQHHLPSAVIEPHLFSSRSDYDAAILETLQAHQVDLVILAGYDKILGHALLSAYPGLILNIHPSLLPAYGGKGMVGFKVHQAVVNAQETESGCSVHLVTETVDGGPILGQARVSVTKSDTAETLAQKVLAQEHQLYPAVIVAYVEKLLAHVDAQLNESTPEEACPECVSS